MTATVKKVKAAPKPAAKKSGKAPVVAQTRKVTKAKKTVQAGQLFPVEHVEQIVQVAQLVHVEHVESVAQVAVMAEVVEAVVAMPPAIARESDNRIVLPARMELASLEEAHHLLQSNYPPIHAKYILDGALLSVIDMAGIQMLISFISSMTAKGCKVEWDNYSVQMYQLASELGVTDQLGD
ncbi:MAG: STAS domain-containing protein [Pseudomonadota bacterium]